VNINIILPAHNEENFIGKALQSLFSQTVDVKIIIVDDGSTDSTAQIIKDFSSFHQVKVVTRKRKENKDILTVSFVIGEGSKYIDDDFDFIGILDADTILEPQYYEKLIKKFKENSKLGLCGGKYIGQPHSTWFGGLPYIYGCNRLYSRKCWLAINNGDKEMIPLPTWDTYHNIQANMLGFETRFYGDVISYALRPSGEGNDWRMGYVSYLIGYYGWFMLMRIVRKRSLLMLAGYLRAWFSGLKQYPIKPYVRHLQLKRMKRIMKIC